MLLRPERGRRGERHHQQRRVFRGESHEALLAVADQKVYFRAKFLAASRAPEHGANNLRNEFVKRAAPRRFAERRALTELSIRGVGVGRVSQRVVPLRALCD